MSNFNTFKQTVREALLANSGVTTLVSTRVFGAQLATLFEVPYPCLTFHFEEGQDVVLLVKQFTMTVSSHSEKHFDEAHDISTAAFEVLKQATLNNTILIHSRGTPYEHYSRESRLYTVHRRYYVNYIG